MRFTPRALPAADPAAFVRTNIENLPTAPKRVEVIVHAPMAAIRGKVGQWATLEDVDAERCMLRMNAENMDWPALALGSIGAEFEIVAPAELVEHVREWGRRFTRATSGT